MPSALFRVDATPALGGGHVMRCLTLAGALAARGYDIAFACVAGSERAAPSLSRAPFPVIMLASERDPEALLRCLPTSVDLLVLDHYGLDAAYERQARSCARTLLVIDDLVNRPHDCDILLDQTFGRDALAYRELVPPHARVLAGATYALLRPEFEKARPRSQERRRHAKGVQRILISLGLTDPAGLTARLLEAALAVQPDAAIDVVLGPAAPHLAAVEERVRQARNVSIHIDPPSLADLMLAADLAIGAAGTSAWERCCLGLPSITIAVADNQVDLCLRLAEIGAIAEWHATGDLVAGLRRVFGTIDLGALSERSAALVDGRGAERVADAVLRTHAAPQLRLRRASAADAESLWKWRNDSEARRQSLTTHVISWGDHVRWLQATLASPDSFLVIGEVAAVPCGAVRLDRQDSGAIRISMAVDAALRGRGYGLRLLSDALQCANKADFSGPYEAIVKPANETMVKILQRLGFTPAPSRDASLLRLTRP